MVKKGSKGAPPTRSKKAKAKEKPKVKEPKAVAVSEEPSIRHFDASQSLGPTADVVSTAPSPATAPVQAPPAASQPPPTAEAAAAPAAPAAPVGPAETSASAAAAATTPAAPQATEHTEPTEPQSTQPAPTAELPGPTPAGPAGVRRRAAPGTRLPPMQDGDPLETDLAKPRKRRFMLKRGLPALSCSLGAAPGHKYRQPDYQELANQHPLIHKALEVARHGKQKHWNLDDEESDGPPGSMAWNLEENSKDPKADSAPDTAIATAEPNATNADPAPEIWWQELKANENHVAAQ